MNDFKWSLDPSLWAWASCFWKTDYPRPWISNGWFTIKYTTLDWYRVWKPLVTRAKSLWWKLTTSTKFLKVWIKIENKFVLSQRTSLLSWFKNLSFRHHMDLICQTLFREHRQYNQPNKVLCHHLWSPSWHHRYKMKSFNHYINRKCKKNNLGKIETIAWKL